MIIFNIFYKKRFDNIIENFSKKYNLFFIKQDLNNNSNYSILKNRYYIKLDKPHYGLTHVNVGKIIVTTDSVEGNRISWYELNNIFIIKNIYSYNINDIENLILQKCIEHKILMSLKL
jgi:hypothetical protein